MTPKNDNPAYIYDETLEQIIGDRKIAAITDNIAENHFRTQLTIFFTDGTEIEIYSCECCDGMRVVDPIRVAEQLAKRKKEEEEYWDKRDAEAREKGWV